MSEFSFLSWQNKPDPVISQLSECLVTTILPNMNI